MSRNSKAPQHEEFPSRKRFTSISHLLKTKELSTKGRGLSSRTLMATTGVGRTRSSKDETGSSLSRPNFRFVGLNPRSHNCKSSIVRQWSLFSASLLSCLWLLSIGFQTPSLNLSTLLRNSSASVPNADLGLTAGTFYTRITKMAEQQSGFDLFLQFLQNPMMYVEQEERRRRGEEAYPDETPEELGQRRLALARGPVPPSISAGGMSPTDAQWPDLMTALHAVQADPGTQAEARGQLERAGVLRGQERELQGIRSEIGAHQRGAAVAEALRNRLPAPSGTPAPQQTAQPRPAPAPAPAPQPTPAPVQAAQARPMPAPIEARTPSLPAPVHSQMTPEILNALLANRFNAPAVNRPTVPNVPVPVVPPAENPFAAIHAANPPPNLRIETGVFNPTVPAPVSTGTEPPPFPNMPWQPPPGYENGPPFPFPAIMNQQATAITPAGGPGALGPFSGAPAASAPSGIPAPVLSPLTAQRNAAIEAFRRQPPPTPQVVEINPPGTFVNPNSMRNVTPTAGAPRARPAPQAPQPVLAPMTATPPLPFDAALQGAPQPTPQLAETPNKLRSVPSAPTKAPAPSQGGPSLPTPTPQLGDAIDPRLKAQLLAMLQAETLARLQAKNQPVSGVAAAVPGP